MRTEQLEYVSAVARLGSFRRAAEALHISQPALSETVRNLERELGVTLFDRGRGGASLSSEGRDLLAHVAGVIEAVDGLRQAADAQHQTARSLRLGTVNAGTVTVLAPALADFGASHPDTQVEVVGAQESEIHRGLHEGAYDLGLITCLGGEDPPPDLESHTLLRGRPVVCLPAASPLLSRSVLEPEDLRDVPFVMMREGYLMHRYVSRILGDRPRTVALCTDGAEMGKLMVAEGVGITVLPDFSVRGDPLERAGLIVTRPLRDDAGVELALRRRRTGGRAARDLHRLLCERAARAMAEVVGAIDRTDGPRGDSDRRPLADEALNR